jgi:hypothetical protein
MGSSSQTTNSSQNSNTASSGTSTTAPGWAPQLADLTNAFNLANGALSQSQGATATPGTNTSFDTSGLYNNGGTLNTSGTNATTGALTGLSNYDPTTQNNPAAISAAAKQYADSQNIGAQTAAATNQAMETARDVTLPGIEQNAAISGNTNSSRAGIADGLVQRSLAENAQNTYNSLYGQAYGQGLSLASSNANANNSNELGALNDAAGQGTSAANAGASDQAAALSNTGTQNTNNENNFLNSSSNPYAALANYMKIIGSTNWGSTTSSNANSATQGTGTSTTQTNPSALSVIGGLLGATGQGLSLFGL